MEIADWIDECIEKYINGIYNFYTACIEIGRHEKLNLINYTRKSAIFRIKSIKYRTNIIINNDKLTMKHDPEFVLDMVSFVSQISTDVLKMKSRKREITEARFAYCLLNLNFIEDSGLSVKEIGRLVNISHADVLHAKKVAHLKNVNEIYQKTLELL